MNKKLVIIFLAVSIISVGITFLLISMKPSSNAVDIFSSFGSEVEKEKGVDLDATYDQNDLEFVSEIITYEGIEHEIKLISGLKDSKVEKAINDELKDCVMKQFEDGFDEVDIYNIGNFSNILSMQVYAYIDSYDENFSYRYSENYFNYDLRTGEKIKFEDLFTKNANVTRLVYRSMLKNEVVDNYYRSLEEAQENYNGDDYYNDIYEKIDSMAINYDDDKLFSLATKFMASNNKKFSITPSRIMIYGYDDEDMYGTISILENSEYIKVYDRYKTTFSLFKSSDIGVDDIFTCSVYPEDYIECYEKGFVGDNLYIDYGVNFNEFYKDSLEGLDADYYASFASQKADEFYDEVKKIKDIAKNDKKHYYVAFFGFEDSLYSMYQNYGYEKENGEFLSYVPSNAIVTSHAIMTYKAPISMKDQMISFIKESYRTDYFNYALDRRLIPDDYEEFDRLLENKTIELTDTYYSEMYNYKTKERLTTLDQIFVDNHVTEETLIEKFKQDLREPWRGYSERDINEVLSNGITYTFDTNSIVMTAKNKLGGEEVKTWYYFSDIEIYYYKIFDDKYINYYKNIYGINDVEETNETEQQEEILAEPIEDTTVEE